MSKSKKAVAPTTGAVHELAVKRAIMLLTAAKCQFAIIDSTGQQHGQLQIHVPEEKRTRTRILTRPYGALKNHYIGYVEKLKVGEASQVPFGDFDPEDLRGAITAWMSVNWGKGTYTSCTTDRHVEVLRIA